MKWLYILGGGAVLVALAAHQTRKVIDNFQVNLRGINLNSVNFLNIVITADLEIVNPANVPAKLLSVAGQVIYNKNVLGNYVYNETTNIPARGSVILPVRISLSNLQILQNVKNLLDITKLVRTLTIKGVANFGVVLINFETNV